MGNSTHYNTSIYTTLGGCPGDYLEISDGSSSQRYCGTSTPAPLTTTNTITVKLHLVTGDASGVGFLGTACCSVAMTSWQPLLPVPQTIQAILLQYSHHFFNAINTVAPTNNPSSSLQTIIWSPNYPAAYDGNYAQVKHYKQIIQSII